MFPYYQPALSTLFNNCIKLYYIDIRLVLLEIRSGGRSSNCPPVQKKLSSKSPGLLWEISDVKKEMLICYE